MKYRWRLTFKLVASVFAVGFVLSFLLADSDPRMPDMATLDTGVNRVTGNAQPVKTKMDLISKEYILKFPGDLNGWKVAETYSVSDLQKALGAEALLLRAYANDNDYRTVSLSILRSQDVTSFHAPERCWTGSGYKIEQQGTAFIKVNDTSWASNSWRSTQEGTTFKGEVLANRIVMSRENSRGEIIEKKATLYFYIKEGIVNNKAVMVLVQSDAPVSISPEDTIKVLENFAGEVIPSLFMQPEEIENLFAARIMKQYGIFLGWLILIAAVLIPVIIIYLSPVIGKRRA